MKRKNLKGTIIGAVIPVIILVVILVLKFVFLSGNDSSLTKYVIISVSGVDGKGKISLTLDDAGIMAEFVGKNGTDKDEELCRKFVDSITLTADKQEGLSNGDKVTITMEYSKSAAKKAGIDVGKTTKKYKVGGLVKGSRLDAFADVQVVTGGVSPYMTVSCINNSNNDYLKTVEYSVDKPAGLAIGDTITITCLADEASAAEEGYYFDTLSMEYTITEADRYAKTAEEIDNSVILSIADEAVTAIDDITKDTTSHMTYEVTGNKGYLYKDGNEEAVNFNLYKAEFARNTLSSANEHENYVLVYMYGQIRIPDYSESEDPYEYIDAYFCFLFDDAVITKDGEFVMTTSDLEDRYFCASTYSEVQSEAMEYIGSGYDYSDISID